MSNMRRGTILDERQVSLFLAYPDVPAARPIDTSEAAADTVAQRAPSLRDRCLQLIKASPAGLTADECAEKLGETAFTIRPRISELKRLGQIRDSGERHENESGANAVVWIASEEPSNDL